MRLCHALPLALFLACGPALAQNYNGFGLTLSGADMLAKSRTGAYTDLTMYSDNAALPDSKTVVALSEPGPYKPSFLPGLGGFYQLALAEGGYHFLRLGIEFQHQTRGALCPLFGRSDVYQSSFLDLTYDWFLHGQRKGLFLELGASYGNARFNQTARYPGDLNPDKNPRYESVSLTSSGAYRGKAGFGYGLSRRWDLVLVYQYEQLAPTTAQVQTAFWNGSAPTFDSPVTALSIPNVSMRMGLVQGSVNFHF